MSSDKVRIPLRVETKNRLKSKVALAGYRSYDEFVRREVLADDPGSDE